MDMVGGEEGEEMYIESNTEIYNTVCKIDSQWEFCCVTQGTQTGALRQAEGWDGVGERWEGGDMGIPMADSC